MNLLLDLPDKVASWIWFAFGQITGSLWALSRPIQVIAAAALVITWIAHIYARRRKLKCPRCHSPIVRHSFNAGVVEKILSLAPIHAFLCVDCGCRFMKVR